MAQTKGPLPKQSKTQLLEEYKKLEEKYDELKMTSQLVHDPRSLELMEKARDYTTENFLKSLATLKESLNQTLEELSNKLLVETKRLEEIQQAMEIAKKNLELHYHIQVAADTLEKLMLEHETKKRELIKEMEKQQEALEDEITAKRREWAREQEEFEFEQALDRKREARKYEEEIAMQKKEIAEQESLVKQQMSEFQRLKEEVEEIPEKLEKAQTEREQEVTKRLKEDFERRLESAKKDWQSQEIVYKLKISGLEDQLKKQFSENASLKEDMGQANLKAQELAIRVIESSTPITLPIRKNGEKGPARMEQPQLD